MKAQVKSLLIRHSYIILFLLALLISLPFGGANYVLVFYMIMFMLSSAASGMWFSICWLLERAKMFWLSQYMPDIASEAHRYILTVYTLLYWAVLYGLGWVFPDVLKLIPWDPFVFAPPLALLFWAVYRHMYYRMPTLKISGDYLSLPSWFLLIGVYETTHAITNFIFKFSFPALNLFS